MTLCSSHCLFSVLFASVRTSEWQKVAFVLYLIWSFWRNCHWNSIYIFCSSSNQFIIKCGGGGCYFTAVSLCSHSCECCKPRSHTTHSILVRIMCLFFSSYCQKAIHKVSQYCTGAAVTFSCSVIKGAWLGPYSHGFLTSSFQHELCSQLFHSYCTFCS